MPKFDITPLVEAESRSALGKRSQITMEYLEILSQLKSGQAGKLESSKGERSAAVRRRLGSAAKLVGRELIIKRRRGKIYFWDKPGRAQEAMAIPQDREHPLELIGAFNKPHLRKRA